MTSTIFTVTTLLLAAGLFVGMLLLLHVGRRIGLRHRELDPEGSLSGTAAIDGATFGILGLLVALSFSGASERLDARRQLIVRETNAIGTAYLRLDLLPESAQRRSRELFRQYVDARIDVYRSFGVAEASTNRAASLQREIWGETMQASRADGVPSSTAMLLAPALNEMIDITTSRAMTSQMHPPFVVFAMLIGTALMAALLAGYAMAARKSSSWLHGLGFAFVTATAFYVICDLEYPRYGFIRVDAFDAALVTLRNGMN